MDRSEDLKQVRDLHLVRVERDREVEAAAGLRAGNAVVLVSQLLSAVCLLQDDPAWMALLSLTLVWGGVKGFWRFRQDQERLYLVWGLLTCAGAAALLGLYFHRAWSARDVVHQTAGLRSAVPGADGGRRTVICGATAGYLLAGPQAGAYRGRALGAVFPVRLHRRTSAAGGCCDGGGPGSGGGPQRSPVRRLGFQEPGLLAALFFVARGAYLLNKFSRRRDELIQKLLKLKR